MQHITMYKNINLKQRNFISSREIKVNKNIDLTLIEKSIFNKQEIPIFLDVIDPKPYAYKNNKDIHKLKSKKQEFTSTYSFASDDSR